MLIHADLSQRIVLKHHDLPWMASPVQAIERRMLDREGGEVARATSVVRYAVGAQFTKHAHDAGEEIFVLEDEFCDEHGTYPAGTNLKNPAGSSHTPQAVTDCLLFVKLRHLESEDRERQVINTAEASWYQGMVEGLTVMPLSEFGAQHTALVRWAPQTYFKPHRHVDGEEILVIDVVFEDEHGRYPAGSWIRSPHLSANQPFSKEGCMILVKTGHLI